MASNVPSRILFIGALKFPYKVSTHSLPYLTLAVSIGRCDKRPGLLPGSIYTYRRFHGELYAVFCICSFETRSHFGVTTVPCSLASTVA